MAEFIREGCGKRIGVSVCRRVGVCKASSTPSRPPDHYSRVEKQSYFPRRRYADPPTRFPSRRPILIATIYLLFRGQDTIPRRLSPAERFDWPEWDGNSCPAAPVRARLRGLSAPESLSFA